jgi:hypothetical protein
MLEEILRVAGWKNGHNGNGNGAVLDAQPPERLEGQSPTIMVPPVRFDKPVEANSELPRQQLPTQASDALTILLPHNYDAVAIDSEPSVDHRSVVHEALKGLDVWFGYQVSALEKDALRHATAWAEKGLPRHDLDVNEPIEVEKDLRNRARQTYWQWVREVRRRMNGALSRQLTALGNALSGANRALESYRQAQDELARLNPREDLRETTREPTESVLQEKSVSALRDTRLAESHVPALAFWLLTVGLVLAEFIANAPIFTELFPQDAQIDAQVVAMTDTGNLGWLFGLKALAVKLLAYPDPAFLAFSVVVFFLFLGHKFGSYLRRWVAYGSPHVEVPQELCAHLKRQTTFVVWASVLAIFITLGVLFWARGTVFDMAKARYDNADTHLKGAKDKVAQAENSPDHRDVNNARTDRNFWMVEYQHRQRRLDYAESISKMNIPITGLNLVLVIAAAIAGFSRQSVTVTADQKASVLPGADRPPTVPVRRPTEIAAHASSVERVVSLRGELRAERVELALRLADAQQLDGKVVQLIGAQPMREWRGITSRLSSAVPMFRAENARLRNLDPRDIKAFNSSTELEFDEPTFESPAEALQQLVEYRNVMASLKKASEEIGRPFRLDRRAVETNLPGDLA